MARFFEWQQQNSASRKDGDPHRYVTGTYRHIMEKRCRTDYQHENNCTPRGNNWDRILGKRSTTPILGSCLKFKGQNLGYTSPIFLEVKFGALAQISEARFGAKLPDLLIMKYLLGTQYHMILNQGHTWPPL